MYLKEINKTNIIFRKRKNVIKSFWYIFPLNDYINIKMHDNLRILQYLVKSINKYK